MKPETLNSIIFTINYQVKKKEKFDHFLTSFGERLQCDLNGRHIERYAKIPEQFQAVFQVETSVESNAERVYEMLRIANMLTEGVSGSWTFLGPDEDDELSFECIFNGTGDDQPLKWAHLST